jgi:uncharacterized protein YqhQ
MWLSNSDSSRMAVIRWYAKTVCACVLSVHMLSFMFLVYFMLPVFVAMICLLLFHIHSYNMMAPILSLYLDVTPLLRVSLPKKAEVRRYFEYLCQSGGAPDYPTYFDSR